MLARRTLSPDYDIDAMKHEMLRAVRKRIWSTREMLGGRYVRGSCGRLRIIKWNVRLARKYGNVLRPVKYTFPTSSAASVPVAQGSWKGMHASLTSCGF
jgi:hypothetical protein